MPDEPNESASQEMTSVIDTGEESFAVDNIKPAEVQEKSPAEPKKEPEKKESEKPEKDSKGTEEPETKEAENEPPIDDELPKGIQKRINTITRKRRDAERELEELRKENASLKTAAQNLKESTEEPKIDDFENEEDYQNAIIDYRVERKLSKQAKEAKKTKESDIKEQQETDAQEKMEGIQKKIRKGFDKYSDFENTIADLDVTDDMLKIMDKLPNIVDIVYYLGKNPEIAIGLTDISKIDVTFQLKDISDTLKAKKTTKAPKPIKPTSATGASIKTMENMTMAEYNKARDQQDKERRGKY